MANAGTDGGAGGPDSPEAPQPVFCHMCQVVTHAARGEGGEPACARCSGSFIEYVEGEETMQEEEPQPDPGEEPMDPFHQLLSQYMHMVASQQQEGGSTQSQSSEQRNSESSSSSQQHGGMPGSLQALLSQMLSSNMSNAINAIQGGGPVLSFGDYILDGDLDRIAAELGRQNPVPSAQQPASQEAINNLEHVTLGKDKLQETDTTCPVCSDSFDEVSASGSSAKRMPCGHLFHDECLLPWLSRARSCPCCRQFIAGTEEGEE